MKAFPRSEIGRGIIRFDFHDPIEILDRLLQVPQGLVDSPAVEMGLGIFGIEVEGLVVFPDRQLMILQGLLGDASVKRTRRPSWRTA